MKTYWFYIWSFYLFFNIFSKCKEIENKNVKVLANYKNDNNIGSYVKSREVQTGKNIKISSDSNYNEYSFLHLKASSIFNQHYVAKLINTILYKGLYTKGYFHRNVAVYESLSRTNFFFYLTVLNKKNLRSIVKLISKSDSSKKNKYDVFKKQLMSNFNCPPFEMDDTIKNEMDQALIIYKKAKTDSYWNTLDALKTDGLLLAKTFMSVSFVQSIRGIIGVINHELIDLCFSNAYLYNHIASFDKLIMNNTFGVIMSYVFKSFLLFFYPLIMPFRGAFAFAISSFCITQLSKIVFAIYRNVRRLYRISYRKLYLTVLKFNLLKQPELQDYAMKLLYGDGLILVSKIWKLSYLNVTDHLSGKNLHPILNNLFEKNLGTGFFEFSHSLFKYVIDALNDLKLLSKKDGNLDTENEFNSETFKKVLLVLKITRKTLYYEESYMRLAVANLLAKFYVLFLVNINYISKMNPKEFFYNDLDSEFRYIYEDQTYETYLQKISSDITTKPFIKKNVRKINRGSIEFTLSLVKIRLLHYKPSLNFPYSSLYFDETLKKQLSSAMKLIIIGATSIVGSFVNYGDKFAILKKCPLDIIKNLNLTCDNTTFEVKKLLFPLNIFINLVIPLFLDYKDVIIDKSIINNIVEFFKVIIDSKDIYLYTYMKNVVDTIKKSENLDTTDLNYEEEINKVIHDEINKVINEVNTEKVNSLKFHTYTIDESSVYLHNKEGHMFKFAFDQDNNKDSFSRLLRIYDYRNPMVYQMPYIKFEPLGSNRGNLVVGFYDNKFQGQLTPCHMCLKEDDDVLVVDLIHHVLWASGVDRFSSFIGSSWKRAVLNMAPTEFYEVHRIFMDKTSQEKDKSQNVFIRRIKKYRFNFNKASFSKMFKTFLENVLNKINFFNAEEATIILVMSALYALYKNIEKYEIPLNETYKLYQQKLIEAFFPVTNYAHNYETYTRKYIKEKRKAVKAANEEAAAMGEDATVEDTTTEDATAKNGTAKEVAPKVQLTMDDEVVKNTKYLQLEIESREHERAKLVEQLSKQHGEIPNYEEFPHLPGQCLFLLYFDYTSFIEHNLNGIENVVNKLRNNTIDVKHIRNMNNIQTEKTKYSSIRQKDLIRIMCGTHLFLKKENVSIDDMYKFDNANNTVKHLLIILALLRIEKKTNRHTWKRFLTLEKYLDQRRKYYKTPLKYLYLKLVNVKRVFAYTKRRAFISMGKQMKGRRFLNILRYTKFFEIMENAELINEYYPHAYIKFEDIQIFSNVFHKFKYSLIRYTSDQQNIRNMLNNFKLAPNTSVNNEHLLLRIFRILHFLVKQKFDIDLYSLKKNEGYFDAYSENKNEHILNGIKLNPVLEKYLFQLFGFLKLLTDMKFTNFLFLRNLFIFIKFYAFTGDLDYSISSSAVYLANKNYLKFILNSILEFERFKKFIQKRKETHDIRKYPIDHYNFQVECFATDDIKNYKISTSDMSKLNRYYEIMGFDIPNFYKDYLLLDLFYDDLDVKNLDYYYQKINDVDRSTIGPNRDVYLPGSRNNASKVSLNELYLLNGSIQNYVYLEKFLQRTNIPTIPFDNFTVYPNENTIEVHFTNRAKTVPFYKENILDQFEIIGKSLITEYYNKVKCSFVSFPFYLYYWLILNPGKPNVETISKSGLIKEEDLKPKSKEDKDEEEFKMDENIVKNVLSDALVDEEIKEEHDLSDASTSEGEDSDFEFADIDSESEEMTKTKKHGESKESLESSEEELSDSSEPSSEGAESSTTVGSYASAKSDISPHSYVSAPSSASTTSNLSLASLGSSAPSESLASSGSATSNLSLASLQSTASNLSLASKGTSASSKSLYSSSSGSTGSDERSSVSHAFLQTSKIAKKYKEGNTYNGAHGYVDISTKRENVEKEVSHSLLYKNYSNSGEAAKTFNDKFLHKYSLQDKKGVTGHSFLQKQEINILPFESEMINEKSKGLNKGKYGYFDRPYNMYVPKTNIFRNFNLVLKVVHTLISLNKFSVVTPEEIIKKGLSVIQKKNKFMAKQKLNPFINKMILDINETIQSMKSSSEKGYNIPKSDILSLYKIVEFQLFNQYLIYPPLKRLKENELKYILEVVNQGYYFYMKKLILKLRREQIVKNKVVRILSTFSEYRNLFDEVSIEQFYQVLIESLRCRNVQCFDNLFNDFITFYYGNILMRLTNTSSIFLPMEDIFRDKEMINTLREQVQDTYINFTRLQREPTKIDLENTTPHVKLTYKELVFGSLDLAKKIETWNSLFTLFNVRHIYMNVGYILLGVKYHIKRSHRVFLHTFDLFGWLRKNKKNSIYIP
ncbi:rhoptry neck protein 3, putative [Plasmodium ovale]|uniref:Rhoptry neck protein 3, putative n=1 Tax=Plasmodium ovale TaxID=36330 RepID=A0A1D3UB39_PLAOA|nr:rhoptry neck protein 3, putative [Plasmodium ovale]